MIVQDFLQDLHFGIRSLGRSPAFTIAAVLTLALGMGANTAIFTVVYSVLLRPLEYPASERLVRITGGATVDRAEMLGHARSFESTGLYLMTRDDVSITGSEHADALKGAQVSTNFLQVLHVNPLHGRGFLAEESQAQHRVAIISADLWQKRFGADPKVVGSKVTLGGAPYTIVGVMPVGVSFPDAAVDVWRPFQPDTMEPRSRANSPILNVFARLRDEATLDSATAEIKVIQEQYVKSHPGKLDARPQAIPRVAQMKDELVGNVRDRLWILLGAVGLLFLIACANVAGLLLARAAARTKEFTIRAALGAGRGRILRQVLTESLLLATAACAIGLILADWSLSALLKLDLPRVQEVRFDLSTLLFAAAIACAATVLSGIVPALRASRTKVVRPRFPARNLLVAGQVALCVVLLIGAGLLIESLGRLHLVETGFSSSNLLTMRIPLSQSRYGNAEKATAFYDELIQRVQSLPGVRSAAVTFTLPMTGWAGTPVQAVGQPIAKLNERPIAILQTVTPGYFRTMGMELKRGRDFASHDRADRPKVAVITEALAKKLWPSEDALGKSLLAGTNPEPVQIIGIAKNYRQSGLDGDNEPALFRPRAQTPPFSAMFAIRTEGDPMRFANAIRNEVTTLDRDLAITDVKTMDQIVDASESQRENVMMLLSVFAGAGLLLAIIGIYGLMAYSVAQSAKELGIRTALGAQQRDILWLVFRQVLLLSGGGVGVGLIAAFGLTRVLKTLLYGVSATDPAVFGAVGIGLLGIALIAALLPARRAARIDPASVLRVS